MITTEKESTQGMYKTVMKQFNATADLLGLHPDLREISRKEIQGSLF